MADSPAAKSGELGWVSKVPRHLVAFDAFPWSKKKAFLQGLIETLGGAATFTDSPTLQSNCLWARSVYYKRETRIAIDITEYAAFVSENPGYPSVDSMLLQALFTAKIGLRDSFGASPNFPRYITEFVASSTPIDPFADAPAMLSYPQEPNPPAWQQSAPQKELRVSRDEVTSSEGGGDAPYPDKFAKVVEAVQSGKEVEGIRLIPDKVIRQPGITPIGKMAAPKKPWEKVSATTDTASVSEQTVDGGFAVVDKDFPLPEGHPQADRDENGWTVVNE